MPFHLDIEGYKDPYQKEYLEGFAAEAEHRNKPCPYDPNIEKNKFDAWHKGKTDAQKNNFPK